MQSLLTSNEILAYAAGLLDGEGCIWIAHQKSPNGRPSHTLVVSIDMTRSAPVLFMHEHFGGGEPTTRTIRSGKTSWRWALRGKNAADFLEKVLPALLVKKAEAKIGLLFQETILTRGENYKTDLTKDKLELREKLMLALRSEKEVNE